MNIRSIRFLTTELRKFAIITTCMAIPVIGGMLLCQSLLMKMLREDAQATSSEWASELLAQNPDVLALFSNSTPSLQTMHVLDTGTKLGPIYRFRLWDTSGNLVYKSERLKTDGAPIVLSKKRSANAVALGSIVNEVHRGGPPQNVPFFVESFIPVKRNGIVVGVFDIFLDQSDNQVIYKRSLFLTETIIAILVLIAGGIPGHSLYRQMLKLRDAREDAQFQSEHDRLTGLPNRISLEELARTALALSRRNRKPLAALMIDMDRFKDINDTLGHVTGDKVLKAVAKRLRSSLREGDSVGRFGGDEFVVLQASTYQPAGARFLADRLIALLSEPYEIDGTKLVCGACIGVAILPPDAEDFDTLMACADAALHKAKAEGRNSLSFFEPGMDERIRQRRQIETDIRLALATNAFQLAYQPQYSFRDGGLLGFEALLRWPEGWPAQSPADFIPVAEESGLIDQLGVWALETACRTAAGWPNPVKVAVNLSPIQFRHSNIVSIVEEALRKSGLEPERLELEVTENLWIQNTDTVLTQLKRLHRMGVSIALDDFGTGYSSLSYLWKFPFDTVKIDQSFVRGMETEPKAAAIVNTIMALGRILDLTITAEGVETAEQARILREAGCDQAQGFLFARPLPIASANALANEKPIFALQEPDTIQRLAAS